MSYTSILVHVLPERAADARLTAAVDLARRLDATLIGVGAETPRILNDPYGNMGDWSVVMHEQVVENLKLAEAKFRAAAEGLRIEWRADMSMPGGAQARAARAADLIVAGGCAHKHVDPYRMADSGELTLAAGRPVLIVPQGESRLRARRIVLAWKDTREARRAVADALPLLKTAEAVLVQAVCDKHEVAFVKDQTDDVVRALQRHGVEAAGSVVAAPADDVCARLIAAVEAHDADLLVAGAYGHSRFGEWALGGVSAALLGGFERFLMLSH